MRYRTSSDNRRAGFIVIAALAAMLLFFAASQVLVNESGSPSSPVAPLVGAVNQAKATADAASRAAQQRDRQAGADTSDLSNVAGSSMP